MQNFVYDSLDRKIASLLSQDATLTNSAIGDRIGLSASATHERIRKLKSGGKIKRVVAFLEGAFMDKALGAFISVLLEGKDYDRSFVQNALEHESVLECHHITGDYSYLLKIRVADTKALENFITEFLRGQKGVIKTMSQVILSSPKEDSVIIS